MAVRQDPSALNPMSGHYFDRARSLPADRVQLGKWLAESKPRRRLVEHQGIAPCIPAWKAGVCLSTPMLGELESRAGIAPAFAALQAAA